MKRVLVIAVSLLLILLAVGPLLYSSFGSKDSGKSSVPQVTSPVTTVTVPEAPSNPQPAGPSKPKGPEASKLAKLAAPAAGAARIASIGLASVQFSLDPDELARVLQITMTPNKRPVLLKNLPQSAQYQADAFGWSNVAEARASADYKVTPLKWKALRFSKTKASIAVYQQAQFNTGPNPEGCPQPDGTRAACILPNKLYRAVSVTVFEMKMVNGAWLCNGYHDPAADLVPPEETDQTFQQTVKQFQPYLRGYTNYVQAA